MTDPPSEATGEATGEAFGAPGIAPTFAAGDKDAVSTALGASRVWLTIGGGVLNEVFWPHTGRPQLRDLGFLVTGTGFWTEVKRVADYTITTPEPALPLPTVVHLHERYRLTLEFVCDPNRDVVLVSYELVDLTPDGDEALALHLLAAPHIGGSGHDNEGWVDGATLFAARGEESMAIVAHPAFSSASVGYVGASDGWQDVASHGVPLHRFTRASRGNIALTATCAAPQGTIAVGFATTVNGCRSLANASLAEGRESIVAAFSRGWQAWSTDLPFAVSTDPVACLARASAMVLRVHEDRSFPGAIVASLATPWGFAHDDPGGYHLVWPRDCAEAGLALAAVGQRADALRMLQFLASTQSADGHWPQNFTPDGTAYWTGLQLDETALPVILAARLCELGCVDPHHAMISAMVERACHYLAANGPLSDQDRWEEAAGANPFTIAAIVAALAGAALTGFLAGNDATYALSLADWWNARIEALVYVAATELDLTFGTAGHYERIAPATDETGRACVVLANRGGERIESGRLVGLEFLALVRYGLRAATDPRVVDSVTIVDGVLRADVGTGPLYHRYQNDGYGEHDDGSPFDGSGVGRLWPLLAGERGHYALEVGEDPLPYLRAMAASVTAGGGLPEQVWDAAPIAERRLAPGKPTGSAAPLVWAHAEFLKLYLAVNEGTFADRLEAVASRYASEPRPMVAHLRTELDIATDATELSFEQARPFVLHIGTDGWQYPVDLPSSPTGLGLHEVRVARTHLGTATTVEWTRFDPAAGAWEGVEHRVRFS